MHSTDHGLLALIRHEGIVPGPYRDARGVWTFGIGHTAAAGPPDPEKMPRGMPTDPDARIRDAFRIFRSDLERYEAEVRQAIRVPLEPHEFDALVSFHYNTGGVTRAALTRHLNSGERIAAAAAFLNWRRPAAIIPRRKAERDLFRHARYPTGPISVWSVDRSGRINFSRSVRLLNEDEAMALLNPPDLPKLPVIARKPSAPSQPAGWFARLAVFVANLIRRI